MTIVRYTSNFNKSYIFKLSIPIFFSNLAIPMVGVVDTALMGHLENAKFLAAVGVATTCMSMILWSFGFLRMGTTGLVAQALGKGDYRELVMIVVRNLAIGVFISLILILLKDQFLAIINYFFFISGETMLLVSDYISIRILSAPAELTLYVIIGTFLGLQKTKISSLIVIIYSLLNILLSLHFVINNQLEIYGVALGTLLSGYITAISFLLFLYFYLYKKFKVKPKLVKIFNKKRFIKLIIINFDIFIRTLFLTFAFLWVTYLGSKMGEDYLALNAILIQFIILSAFFLDSYAYSTEGVIGYLIGKKNKKSFLKAVKISFDLSFTTAIIISLIYIIFFKYIINFMTDLDYLRYLSNSYIFWIILLPPVASFCYQFDGIFIGAAQTKEMRNSIIISVVLFVIISIYLVNLLGNHGLWLSLIMFMVFRSLTLNFYFFKIMKKF